MSSKKRSMTIKDVARAAGVSVSTVSKILNDTKPFPEDTRAKVLDAARRAGYAPNPQARSVATGRTSVIGIKILDIANPYFANIVKGAQRQAFDAGYSLVVADSQEDPEAELATLRELARRCDGLVLAGSRLSDERLARLPDVPTVLIGRAVPSSGAVCIHHPFEMRLALAVEHLLDLGHRCVAVALPRHLMERTGFLDRYRDRERSIRIEQVRAPDISAGEEFARDLFSRPSRPTAIVGYNDLMCYGIMRAARDVRVRIPEDLSLVGSDDLVFNDIVTPALTSVSSDQTGMGAQAIEILTGWIREGARPERALERASRLVLRSSTAPPRSTRGLP